MNNNDKKQFMTIIYGLADNFRDTVTKEGLAFRFNALKEYPIEKIQEAAMQIVKTRKYTKFPTIAEFIHAIEGDPTELNHVMAELQAIDVIDAVKRYGSYNPPKFKSSTTQDIVDRLGWGYICSIKEKDIPFFIKDFKELYLNFSRYGDVSNQIECNTKINGLIENIGGN
jgi:hypothetical protein